MGASPSRSSLLMPTVHLGPQWTTSWLLRTKVGPEPHTCMAGWQLL